MLIKVLSVSGALPLRGQGSKSKLSIRSRLLAKQIGLSSPRESGWLSLPTSLQHPRFLGEVGKLQRVNKAWLGLAWLVDMGALVTRD